MAGAVAADALIRRDESVVGRLVRSRREQTTPEPMMQDADGVASLRDAKEAESELHEGCRQEVLAAARTLHEEGRVDFSPVEVIESMQARGTRYAESTIRTHVVSRMCADAPDNHGTTYDDFERVERGHYRLRGHSQ